jgi:hypothetical protein
MNVSRFLTSCGAVFIVFAIVVPATAQLRVDQTNLVSDLPGVAQIQDPNLVNAWGVSFGPTSPFWISDNGTGLATLYSVPGSGPPSVSKLGLTATIPPTAGGTSSAPTGQVFNGGVGFGGAKFLFDSEDGVISGWNGPGGTDTVIGVDKGSAAVYKGLAISDPGASSAVLYATNSAPVRSKPTIPASRRPVYPGTLLTRTCRRAMRPSTTKSSTANSTSPTLFRTAPSTTM